MDPKVSVISAFLLVAGATVSASQEPSANALEAGARVDRVTITPNPIQVARGDTAVGRVVFEDEGGQEIPGVAWDLEGGSGIVNLIRDGTEGDFRLSADRPGQLTLYVAIQLPLQGDLPDPRRIDSVGVLVKDWPVARIEIGAPEVSPYVGTTFKLDATAFTDRETKNEQAKLIWRTEDPCRATVTPSGVVRLIKPGKVSISARVDGITGSRELRVTENPVRTVTVSPGSAQSRTGDPVRFRAVPYDGRGESVDDVALAFSVVPLDSGRADVSGDGVFVAEHPGAYRVLVTAGLSAMSEAIVQVGPRPRRTPVSFVGRGGVAQYRTTDLWVFTGTDIRDYAYTGTRSEAGDARVYVWDVTKPSEVKLTDSVALDAVEIEDIKVNGSGSWAAVAHSGRASAQTGITFLDLSDPAHPSVMGKLSEGFRGRVPNVWVTDGALYAVDGGSNSLRIIDAGDPSQPRHVANWEYRKGEGDKRLFDVWSDNRHLYLSYGQDGLVVLDVTKGGSAVAPAFVAAHSKPGSLVRSAFRQGDYVYIVAEPTNCIACPEGPNARVDILNVSKIEEPELVARVAIPEADARDVWIESDVLHIASSGGAGIRFVDITGRLLGDLYRQGRELGSFRSAAETDALKVNTPDVSGIRLFKGYIFATDGNSGLWVVRHDRSARLES